MEKKAKTFAELFTEYERWKILFRKGAKGNQQAYDEARDTRKYFEEGKWVRLEVAQQEIDNLKTLNDFLNTENLATMKDFCELKKERGEQKQKLRQLKLKFSEIEAIIWAICEPDSLGYIGYTILEEFKKEFGELIKETC